MFCYFRTPVGSQRLAHLYAASIAAVRHVHYSHYRTEKKRYFVNPYTGARNDFLFKAVAVTDRRRRAG